MKSTVFFISLLVSWVLLFVSSVCLFYGLITFQVIYVGCWYVYTFSFSIVFISMCSIECVKSLVIEGRTKCRTMSAHAQNHNEKVVFDSINTCIMTELEKARGSGRYWKIILSKRLVGEIVFIEDSDLVAISFVFPSNFHLGEIGRHIEPYIMVRYESVEAKAFADHLGKLFLNALKKHFKIKRKIELNLLRVEGIFSNEPKCFAD